MDQEELRAVKQPPLITHERPFRRIRSFLGRLTNRDTDLREKSSSPPTPDDYLEQKRYQNPSSLDPNTLLTAKENFILESISRHNSQISFNVEPPICPSEITEKLDPESDLEKPEALLHAITSHTTVDKKGNKESILFQSWVNKLIDNHVSSSGHFDSMELGQKVARKVISFSKNSQPYKTQPDVQNLLLLSGQERRLSDAFVFSHQALFAMGFYLEFMGATNSVIKPLFEAKLKTLRNPPSATKKFDIFVDTIGKLRYCPQHVQEFYLNGLGLLDHKCSPGKLLNLFDSIGQPALEQLEEHPNEYVVPIHILKTHLQEQGLSPKAVTSKITAMTLNEDFAATDLYSKSLYLTHIKNGLTHEQAIHSINVIRAVDKVIAKRLSRYPALTPTRVQAMLRTWRQCNVQNTLLECEETEAILEKVWDYCYYDKTIDDGTDPITYLTEDCGIQNFTRQSARVLHQAVRDRNRKEDYLLIALPKADYNGAFRNDRNRFEHLANQADELNIPIRIIEYDSIEDLNYRLNKLVKRTGNAKAKYVVIGAHGSRDSIQPGQERLVSQVHKKPNISNQDLYRALRKSESNQVKRFRQHFHSNAQVVLDSCLTAADDNGFAATLSKISGLVITGSTEASALSSLELIPDESADFTLYAKYQSGDSVQFSSSTSHSDNPHNDIIGRFPVTKKVLKK